MMAPKNHPEGSKGLYKDNLSGVVGVKVEIRKEKVDEGKLGSGGEGRGKEKEIFLRYKGELGSKTTTATVPWQ